MATTRAKKRDLADYARPPVIEVVYGVRFAPLADWRLPHIGAFWTRVADQFPQCEHAPPIADPNVVDPTTGLPLPRVWLISGTDDRLIQLQTGRFLFNWRHRESAGPYPRYAALSKTFFDLLLNFEEFASQRQLGEIEILEYELTYINHILEEEGWRFPDHIGRVVKELAWQTPGHRFLPPPLTVSWQARFAFRDGSGTLSVNISPAKHAKDARQLLLLEMSARGLPAEAPRKHMVNWFSHAHEWIVRGFEDLTSNEAQTELWGKYA